MFVRTFECQPVVLQILMHKGGLFHDIDIVLKAFRLYSHLPAASVYMGYNFPDTNHHMLFEVHLVNSDGT